MPSEQVLREEARFVRAAIATDERAERTGLGWSKPGICRAAMRTAQLVLDLLLIRWAGENMLEDYILGHNETSIKQELVEEIQEFLVIPAEGYALIANLIAVVNEGSPKPRGRTPKDKDWQSNIETCQSRLQLYPRKWDKGGDGYFWLGTPKIAIWVPTNNRGRGEWKLLSNCWAYLLKKGADNARWTKKWWPTDAGGWSPGLLIGGLRTKRWDDWAKPSGFRKRVERALKEDMEEGSAQLDVLGKIPYISLKGAAFIQYIFGPGIGAWSDLGLEFRKEMKKLGITVGISVPVRDDEPNDPDVCLCCGYYHPTTPGGCPTEPIEHKPDKYLLGLEQRIRKFLSK